MDKAAGTGSTHEYSSFFFIYIYIYMNVWDLPHTSLPDTRTTFAQQGTLDARWNLPGFCKMIGRRDGQQNRKAQDAEDTDKTEQTETIHKKASEGELKSRRTV
jgi:hypothetical protein